jgi:hypothetical protein
MAIRQFLDNPSFLPEDIRILQMAFDRAMIALRIVDRRGEQATVAAKMTLHLFATGEHDPKIIADRVVANSQVMWGPKRI